MTHFRTTLHPAWYQGRWRKPPFFEGWYFKLIDASEQYRYAIIPGIFRGVDAASSHAFVQVLDGITGRATYHRYAVEDFHAAENDFDLHIGPNRFTGQEIELRIASPERTVKGKLHFGELTPWPVTRVSPGIMGWYAWVPLMQCYHGVLSLDHEIQGRLTIDGRPSDFSGGRGYIEKDWGRSFPAAWVWLQSNHFQQPGTSITASVAIIPWLRSAFRGFIIGLWHEGRLYRFATYTGAAIEALSISDDRVHWVVRSPHHRLEIRASRAEAGLLRGPSGVDMGLRVPETLQATVEVRLTALAGGQERLVFEDTGRNGGLEVAGEIGRLLERR